jgi:hypothetical protein
VPNLGRRRSRASRGVCPAFLLMAVVVACGPAATVPSGSAAGTTTAGVFTSDLAVPARVGTWNLTVSSVTLTRNDLLGEMVAAAGGDPSASTHVEVMVADGKDGFLFDVLRVPDVSPDAFAEAARASLMPTASGRGMRPVEGWRVWRFGEPHSATALRVANRGDRIVVIHNDGRLTDEEAAILLAALR